MEKGERMAYRGVFSKVPWGQSVNDSSQVAKEKGSVEERGREEERREGVQAAPHMCTSVFRLLKKKNPPRPP